MSKHEVTCPVCESSYVRAIAGHWKKRELKLKHSDMTCDDCKEKERDRRNARTAAENAEAGLPPLTGSEKQVVWAESIRAEAMRIAARARAGETNDVHFSRTDKCICPDDKEFEYTLGLLKKQSSAHWWIDHRETRIGVSLKELFAGNPAIIGDGPKGFDSAEALAESTIRPGMPITETVAEIRIHEKMIEVVFEEKRDDFRSLIKEKMYFRWDKSSWKRWIEQYNGTAADRTAEAGHRLLGAGYPVRIMDGAIRQKAVSGEYEPEHIWWVTCKADGKFKGWFALIWKGDDEKLYNASRRLPGSKWDSPFVVVPAEQFEEVLGFAQIHGFKLTGEASALVDRARKVKEGSAVADVKPVEIGSLPVKPGKSRSRLRAPENVEVDDEFKDDVA